MATNYRQMFEKALLDSQNGGNQEMQQLEQQIMQKGTGANLAPTMGLVDHLTGSKLAGLVPQEASLKEKLGQVLQMRQQMQSKKLDGLGKLAQMQDAAEARAQDQAYKKEMLGLQQLAAQAKLKKAESGGARKLGTEDIKAIDNIDMILGNLPKLKSSLAKGQSLKPSLLGYTIGGDNEATTARRMVIEALGRLQSGGAIGNEEFKNFENLISSFQDDPTTRAQKIDNLLSEFGRRRNSLYYGPQPLPPSAMASGSAAPMPTSGSQAFGVEDFKSMSQEQVMAYAKMKGMI